MRSNSQQQRAQSPHRGSQPLRHSRVSGQTSPPDEAFSLDISEPSVQPITSQSRPMNGNTSIEPHPGPYPVPSQYHDRITNPDNVDQRAYDDATSQENDEDDLDSLTFHLDGLEQGILSNWPVLNQDNTFESQQLGANSASSNADSGFQLGISNTGPPSTPFHFKTLDGRTTLGIPYNPDAKDRELALLRFKDNMSIQSIALYLKRAEQDQNASDATQVPPHVLFTWTKCAAVKLRATVDKFNGWKDMYIHRPAMAGRITTMTMKEVTARLAADTFEVEDIIAWSGIADGDDSAKIFRLLSQRVEDRAIDASQAGSPVRRTRKHILGLGSASIAEFRAARINLLSPSYVALKIDASLQQAKAKDELQLSTITKLQAEGLQERSRPIDLRKSGPGWTAEEDGFALSLQKLDPQISNKELRRRLSETFKDKAIRTYTTGSVKHRRTLHWNKQLGIRIDKAAPFDDIVETGLPNNTPRHRLWTVEEDEFARQALRMDPDMPVRELHELLTDAFPNLPQRSWKAVKERRYGAWKYDDAKKGSDQNHESDSLHASDDIEEAKRSIFALIQDSQSSTNVQGVDVDNVNVNVNETAEPPPTSLPTTKDSAIRAAKPLNSDKIRGPANASEATVELVCSRCTKSFEDLSPRFAKACGTYLIKALRCKYCQQKSKHYPRDRKWLHLWRYVRGYSTARADS